MELDRALQAVRATTRSVLVTLRRDGRPQISNVVHAADEAGTIRISTTADRAKYANVTREPWASLKVDGEDFWSYAVVEAEVGVSAVASDTDGPDSPGAAALDELCELYRAIAGEHDDWDDYRAAMVRERRVVLRLTPTRAYGALPD